METLEIALVHPVLVHARGAEKQLAMLASGLRKKGHAVSIYTFEERKGYPFGPYLEGCSIISLRKRWRYGFAPADLARWLLMCRDIGQQMGNKFDIINCHNFPAPWVSNFNRTPCVWTCNEPPGIYSLAGGGILSRAGYGLFTAMNRRLCRNLKSIACLDSMMEKMIAGQFPSARIEVSGSGAELDWSVKHLENGITDILCVAAFEPHKRQKDIVEAVAMAKLDDVRVHFVGEGRLKKEIGRLAKERKVEALFHGEVSEKRLGELYSIADVSVFVPELQPWGIFPLESILARIPTILSDQCGVAEIMEKGVPIVRSRDVESLSSVIADAAADRDRYIRDAEDTRKKIERDYNWAKYTERMLGTFRRALQSPEPDREKV